MQRERLKQAENGTYSEVTCARKVLSIFMERHGHDAVCGVEGLLYSVTVVDVDIDVQNSLMVPDEIISNKTLVTKQKLCKSTQDYTLHP